MSFDGKQFGKDVVSAVRGYVDREIDQASKDVTDILVAYIDKRLAGDSKAEKPRYRVPAATRNI